MPGEQKLNTEQQQNWLLEKFTGHESFDRLRGKLQQPVIHRLIGNVQRHGSRRSGQQKFRLFADDLVLIQSIVGQLERDGWKYALGQIELALTVPGYLFSGETIPISQATDVTMYLPKFKQSITVMRWVKKHGGYEKQKQITEEYFRELYPVLPSLEGIYHERSANHGKTITQFDVSLRMAGQKNLEPPDRPFVHQSECCGFVGPHWDSSFGVSYYGWLVSQKWQKDFLGQLPRAYQDALTTWHFKMPTAALMANLYHAGKRIGVGIHPAEEHAKWQKSYPSLTSQKTKEGYGIILWPYKEKPKDYPEENLLLHCY